MYRQCLIPILLINYVQAMFDTDSANNYVQAIFDTDSANNYMQYLMPILLITTCNI